MNLKGIINLYIFLFHLLIVGSVNCREERESLYSHCIVFLTQNKRHSFIQIDRVH